MPPALTLSPADLPFLKGVGIAFAALLLAALLVLLPARERRLVRFPAILVVLHLAALAAASRVDPSYGVHGLLELAAFTLLLAALGRALVILVIGVIAGRRLARPVPKIVEDIVQGVVYFAVLLTSLRAAGVEPGSILTTSALLTAAVALSLQETLGNMVAGLAIQAQRPFDLGDWIQFDGETKHIGRVVEINWRATKVVTLDEVEVIIPNATLAKAPITNFTKPTPTSRRSLYFSVPASVAPHLVQELVLGALRGSFGVVEDPPASVVTNAFVDGNVEYWVRFFTDQFHKRDGVDGAARDRIYYALTRAGIELAAPGRLVRLREESSAARASEEEEQVRRREASLAGVDFLRVLPQQQRRRLAEQSVRRVYGPGETIVRQGDTSAEMFVVETGEVAVVRERAQGDQVLARLRAGEFFGEMSLMTGEARSATVRAERGCVLLVVGPEAFKAVLASAPEIAEHVSRVVAERQAGLAGASVAEEQATSNVEERSSQLLGRIRRFFAL